MLTLNLAYPFPIIVCSFGEIVKEALELLGRLIEPAVVPTVPHVHQLVPYLYEPLAVRWLPIAIGERIVYV